ncbi:hypothetical protein KAQ80_00070, partial [Candidatus Bipolaricaulota bacterium]|nr:hypothetical protein [Candidatus Bipolaricaulota bacterium]
HHLLPVTHYRFSTPDCFSFSTLDVGRWTLDRFYLTHHSLPFLDVGHWTHKNYTHALRVSRTLAVEDGMALR